MAERKSLQPASLCRICLVFRKEQWTVVCPIYAPRIHITRWPVASDHTGKHTFCCMIDRGGRFIIRCRAEAQGKLCNSFLLFLERGSAFWIISPLHCDCNHKSRQDNQLLMSESLGAEQGFSSINYKWDGIWQLQTTSSASTWIASSSKRSSMDASQARAFKNSR